MKKLTKLSFLLLATLPLLRENWNSMVMIICCLLTIISYFSNPFKLDIRSIFKYSIPFWLFLIYELIFSNFHFKETVIGLPFLIFPLLFYLKPDYINDKIKKQSINIFQISTAIQCCIYSFIFLYNNPFDKIFYVSPQNIPFFRSYVFSNYLFQIHPTYFSAFLLVSCTLSLKKIIFDKENSIIHFFNTVFTSFFIFLFSAKIIFLILIVTFLIYIVYSLSKRNRKNIVYTMVFGIGLMVSLFYPVKNNVIYKRFNEIRTEYNKPIKGNYYNSINIRIAIVKCSFNLIKENPLFGFGDDLQNQLNECYKENNESDFYTKSIYNTHNYFIHLILYGGWLFLLIFIMYLCNIFIRIRASFLGILLLFQFLCINLTENFFYRHYGIVLFTYFITFIIFIDKTNDSRPQ